MKTPVFYALTAVIAFTGIVIPSFIAHEVLNPRYMVLSLFAVAAIIHLGVDAMRNHSTHQAGQLAGSKPAASPKLTEAGG